MSELLDDPSTGLMTVIFPDLPAQIEGDLDHENVKNILGGDENGHYHLTEQELGRLRKLLDATFPSGATEPVFPNTNPGGGEWVDPYNPGQEEDLTGGLPKITPPEWKTNDFPVIDKKQHSAFGSTNTLYYGLVHVAKSSTPPTGLCLLTNYSGSTSSGIIIFTKDLVTWTKKSSGLSKETYFGGGTTGISQWMLLDTRNASQVYRLYLMLPAYGFIRYLYNSNNTVTNTDRTSLGKAKTSTTWVACCANTAKSRAIFVSQSGDVAVFDVASYKVVNTAAYSCGMLVTPGSAAYLNTMSMYCVAGPNGTATSTDGASWTKYTSAPKNLNDLCYREDIPEAVVEGGKGLVAWSNDDKHFYASNNGKDWVRMSVSPIPLSTIAAVDYNPDLGWYCAIGGTSQYAYFTKDLRTWIPTQVSSTPIPMGDVIWMPSTKKYVLVPKVEGALTYYTFTPAEWSDE